MEPTVGGGRVRGSLLGGKTKRDEEGREAWIVTEDIGSSLEAGYPLRLPTPGYGN